MDAYSIGNLVGRVLVSYLLVWLVCWLLSKFNYKKSVKKLHSWQGLLAVLVLFLLPLLSQVGARIG